MGKYLNDQELKEVVEGIMYYQERIRVLTEERDLWRSKYMKEIADSIAYKREIDLNPGNLTKLPHFSVR